MKQLKTINGPEVTSEDTLYVHSDNKLTDVYDEEDWNNSEQDVFVMSDEDYDEGCM